MRLPVENSAALLKGISALALAGLVAGCGVMGGGAAVSSVAALPANGPQADYPMLIGDPYQIDGTDFRPSDTLNYDEVGYLAVDDGAIGFTGAHHTLPVPSYVEVTSLESGRTILVRIERRGPMASTHLLALSPAALAQLDASVETPVRVRRVNPPEEQRALLRAGQSAPLRMDTPMSLVSVLRRRLPEAPVAVTEPAPVEMLESVPLVEAPTVPEVERAPEPVELPWPQPTPAPAPHADGLQPLPPLDGTAQLPPDTAPAPELAPVVEAVPAPATSHGGFLVQAAAFSTEERARRAANALGGEVSRSGNYFRVRTGPFPTRAAAEASLANVRAAGYSDARILTDD